MTATQFQEWVAFAELEPFGEDREDARFATVVRIIANVNRDPKKHGPFSIEDCVLSGGDAFGEKKSAPRQSWQEMKMIGMMVAGEWGS